MDNPYLSPKSQPKVCVEKSTKKPIFIYAFYFITFISGIYFLLLTSTRFYMPYNEQGIYFEPVEGVVYNSQAIIFYSIIAGLLLLPTLLLLISSILARLKVGN